MSKPDREVVGEGDCISSLALEHGVGPEAIWEHPQNASLAQVRSDPNVLARGDEVAIPEIEPATFDIPSGDRHVFVVPGTHVRLRLCLQRDQQTIADTEYELRFGATALGGTTDGEGRLEELLPAYVTGARLTLVDSGEAYDLQIGSLEPADTELGATQRLFNLGFFGIADELRDACRRFQAAHGLEEDGELSKATVAGLVDAHGC